MNNTKIYEIKEINNILHQKCVQCLTFKPFELFGQNKSMSNGISRYCKECKSIKDKAEYIKHKERKNKIHKLYYKNHKSIIGENIKQKRKANINYFEIKNLFTIKF